MSEEFEPTPGEGGSEGTAPAAPAAPPERTYNDADMANARRSFESGQSRREAAIRAEYEERLAPKPTPEDPWSTFDPQVSAALRAALDHEWNSRMGPVKQQQDDIAFRNDEVAVKAQFPDYEKNRSEILNYAVQNKIVNLNAAYHAWRSENKWPDVDAGNKAYLAAHLKKKAAQSVGTPVVEGRGGGAPSGKQTYKDRDQMDEAAKALFRATES